ncbi:hypothetical protein IV503_03350 [Klebsiella huaxiensis]|uniref:hypothetical protein n=1 Tax=Klebsiella huaxiensis TaxID=2153354 RepID=UPI002F30B575
MNKIERNVWKLNHIPPLEYCSLSRAQKLLNCEIEDLLHWHDIGAINLCIKLTNISGALSIAITTNDNLAKKYNFHNTQKSSDYKKNEKLWSQHSNVDSIIEFKESVSATETLHGMNTIQLQLKVIVSGLWHVASKNLGELLEHPESAHTVQAVSAIKPTNNILFCHFSPDNISILPISLNKIYIVSADIEKIFEHTINSRPLEQVKAPTLILNKKIIHKPQLATQNKEFIEFINDFTRSNATLDSQFIQASEPINP